MQTRFIAPIALLAAATMLPGCLIASGSSVRESGVRPTRSTLGQIEYGHTTGNWLIAALGEPTARSVVDAEGRTEIFRYEHSVRKESEGAVFLIFAGESEKVTRTITCFEVTDGVVVNHWTEG